MSTDTPIASPEEDSTPDPCVRCKERPAEHDLRSENVCTPCFTQYVQNKAIKRLELLQRETRGPKLTSRPQRYCLALSRGVSSTCLLDVLYDNILQQRSRGQRVKFELSVVAVIDDDLMLGTEDKVDREGGGGYETEEIKKFKQRFPETEIQSLPLSSVLTLDSIDWSALPSTDIPTRTSTATTAIADDSQTYESHRLAYLFSQLPSATSRADVRRLLTRHLILSTAIKSACDVLLLGYNTTSLAELTLSETAKGRGFALPWMVNDGVLPLPRSMLIHHHHHQQQQQQEDNTHRENSSTASGRGGIPVYNPMRDIYRKELYIYLTNDNTSTTITTSASSASTSTRSSPSSSPLSSLLPTSLVATIQPRLQTSNSRDGVNSTHGAVVSHRDLSIDDVMARYFADVEANYPSVVANVVRTTGKLSRLFSGMGLDENGQQDHGNRETGAEAEEAEAEADAGEGDGDVGPKNITTGRCGICGLVLDESGNERWRGEIGEEKADSKGRGKLCYGCERAILG